jgi:hypothetical protein
MDRPTRLPIPDDARLALVGDANGGNVARRHPSTRQRVAGGFKRRIPDILRIVLDQPRAWIVLRELHLSRAANRKVGGKNQGAA